MRKTAGVLCAMALLIPAGVSAAAPAGAAGASCTKITGSATFSPALPITKSKVTAKPTITTSSTISGCTGGGVKSGTTTLKTKSTVGLNCANVASAIRKVRAQHRDGGLEHESDVDRARQFERGQGEHDRIEADQQGDGRTVQGDDDDSHPRVDWGVAKERCVCHRCAERDPVRLGRQDRHGLVVARSSRPRRRSSGGAAPITSGAPSRGPGLRRRSCRLARSRASQGC